MNFDGTPKPVGTNPEAQYARSVWERTNGEGAKFGNTASVRVMRGPRGLKFKTVGKRGGGGTGLPVWI